MKTKILLTLLVLAGLVISFLPLPVPFGAGVASAVSTTATYSGTTLSHDTYIYQFIPATNYGTATTIMIRPVNTANAHVIMDFDFSGFVALGCTKANIVSAKIYGYETRYDASYDPVGRTWVMYKMCRPTWEENDSDWTHWDASGANHWTTAGCMHAHTGCSGDSDYDSALTASATVPATGNWMSWTVTDLVTDAMDNTSNILYVMIKDGTEGATDKFGYLNSSENAANIPYLEITYIPTPTITTSAVTSIGNASATLNGVVASLGCGGNLTNVFFGWDTVTHGDPGNVTGDVCGYAGNWTSDTLSPDYGVGKTFSHAITGLTPSTKYYARAGGNNTCGSGWGDEVTFYTSTNPPQDAYISSLAPTTNYGTEGNLTLWRNDDLSATTRILLSFDLQGVTDFTNTGAFLHLYYYLYDTNDPVGRYFYANRLTNYSWVGNQTTWNISRTGANWDTVGGDYSTTDSVYATMPASYDWVTWNVTALASDAAINRDSILNLLIRDYAESGFYHAAFYSKDYTGNTTLRPYLEIVPYPEITTMAADDIECTSATLNGNVTSVAGGNVTSVLFGWDTISRSLGDAGIPFYGDKMMGYGDSITDGSGASDEAHSYYSLVTNTSKIEPFGWSIDNQAVGGAELPPIVAWQVYPDSAGDLLAVKTYSKSLSLVGYNDMRHWGNDSIALDEFESILYAAVAWSSIPATSKVTAQDAGVTYSGTWTDNASIYGGTLDKSSTAQNAYAEFSVSGTVLYVGLTASYAANFGGEWSITVDTVEKATGTCQFAKASNTVALTYTPFLVRIPSLSSGAHTVRITVTSADSDYVLFDWAGGNEGETTNFFLGNCLHMNVAGYALGSPLWDNGSDAAVTEFNTVISGVASALSGDGLLVTYIDADSYYVLGTDVGPDNAHPNDSGHQHIADAFIDALDTATLTTSLGYAHNYISGTVNYGDGTAFSHAISGETGNTTIYFRAGGNNEDGLGWGNETSFTLDLTCISNTPSSWNAGEVQPSQTYWANGVEPTSWPTLDSADCAGNITNYSSFTVAIDGNITIDGVVTSIVSGSPGPNEVRFTLFAEGGNITDGLILTDTPQEFIAVIDASEVIWWTLELETGTSLTAGVYSATMEFATDPAGDSEVVTITFTVLGVHRRNVSTSSGGIIY